MRHNTLATIRTLKTRNFTIRVTAEEDYDVDLSFDDDGSVRAGLESGKFTAFCVKVVALCKGNEIACDYLGGCIYESPEDFMDHRGIRAKSRADGCNYGSYFSDMIRTVCKEARKMLSTLNTIHIRK